MMGAGVDYGYLWQRGWSYLGSERITGYWASGNGGQYIIVLPDNGMVAVFTGGNYNSTLANQPFELLVDCILPAFFDRSSLEVASLTSEEMQRLAGTYTLDFDPSATSTIFVDGDQLRLVSPLDETIDLSSTLPRFLHRRITTRPPDIRVRRKSPRRDLPTHCLRRFPEIRTRQAVTESMSGPRHGDYAGGVIQLLVRVVRVHPPPRG
jgi:hypothetical protein